MACGQVVGQQLEFGVCEDECSLVTQSVSVTHKSDQKTARDKCGCVIAVAFYNKHADITIEGLGKGTCKVGDSLTLANDCGCETGLTIIEEITYDFGNEDFMKTTIKAKCYTCLT